VGGINIDTQGKKDYTFLKKIPGYNLIAKPLTGLLLNTREYYYREYGLITKHNYDFVNEDNFIKATDAFVKTSTYEPFRWEMHVNFWAAHHAKNLEGDFVECGVYLGCNVISDIAYIDFENLKDRKFYLFDTFCGLDEEFCTKEEYEIRKNSYPDTFERVKKTFKSYKNVILVKGPIPKTLEDVDIRKVAYLSIDMNCVLPEIKALEFFWPKLVKGGVIVLDDYGWKGHEQQKKAEDEFATSVGVKILSLPTGQGLIIKP